MKKTLFAGVFALLAGSLIAADSTAKEDVVAAAKKLGDAASYSWTSTVAVPEDSPFKPGPTEGKMEKEGFTYIKMSFGDNTTEIAMKGDKSVVNSQDGGWQSLSELEADQGPGRFMVGFVRNLKMPPAQAEDVAGKVKEIKKDGDTYSGDLTDEGVKSLLTFGGRRGNANLTNGKGTAKFWIKDGVLSKFEYKTSGTLTFNGNDRNTERTTTVELKDVGATKVQLPEDAKKKLLADLEKKAP